MKCCEYGPNVAIKPSIPSVLILNVVMLSVLMLLVASKPIMLSITKLNVVILGVFRLSIVVSANTPFQGKNKNAENHLLFIGSVWGLYYKTFYGF
jgi:hypothetical protein